MEMEHKRLPTGMVALPGVLSYKNIRFKPDSKCKNSHIISKKSKLLRGQASINVAPSIFLLTIT